VPLPDAVNAQASPHSVGGLSLFDAGAAVNADAVARFYSEDAVIQAAASRLREAGFDVLQISATTINIVGPPQLYEETFNTRLETEERPVIKPGGREDTATFIECPDTALPGLIQTADTPLSDVIEGVAIEEPVYYMQNSLPPAKAYWHLRVPGDVSLGVNADRVHRTGITGRDVKLVMVDTGWFAHPHFIERGYRSSPVVLGPGASNPARDESGHGTGESANAFSAAPDIDFTMVKMNFTNSTGALNTAVALAPQIISCSWGSSVQRGPLSAANQALAAAIATAVASGILVVFSAGNGQYGFPGQHPDVISAGGVYRDQNGALQASSYSSGFASSVYPGRNVPDLSGLVGMSPGASYIMLPVEPGDDIDRSRAGGTHPPQDETAPGDGWAVFSGTSAAAPQIAGVCSLIKQACPRLGPAQVREILMRTARDVTTGTNALGQAAGPAYDLATGAGLVDAHRATLLAKLRCWPIPVRPVVEPVRSIIRPIPARPVVEPVRSIRPIILPPPQTAASGEPADAEERLELSQQEAEELEQIIIDAGIDPEQ
jgi:hypothetical protein